MDETKTFGIPDMLEIWNRQKWVAVLVFLVPFAAVSTLALSLPDLYRATATVLIGRQEISDAFVRSSVTGELETRLETIGQEVLSRSNLLDLIKQFNLYPDLRRQTSPDALIKQMRRDIDIKHNRAEMTWGRSTTIAFTLSFQGGDPPQVANVANTLANLFVQHNIEYRGRQATETAEFLSEQIEKLKQNLVEEERRISAFKEQHIGELPEQLEANLATLERLNTELRLNKETQMRVLERMDMEGLRRDLANATAPDRSPAAEYEGYEGNAVGRLTMRLNRLNQELTELRARYSDKYPDVVRLKAEIAAVERGLAISKDREMLRGSPSVLAEESGRRRHRPRSDAQIALDRLQEEEQKLRQAITRHQERVENAPRREQELQELARDYKATKEHYETVLKRLEDAELAERMEQTQKAEHFRILEPAIPPTMPAAPNRMKLIAIGFVLSLGLAGAAVMLIEYCDTSFHSLDDLRTFTRIPVLASIPKMVTQEEARRRQRLLQLSATAVVLGLVLIVMGSHELGQGNEALARLVARDQS